MKLKFLQVSYIHLYAEWVVIQVLAKNCKYKGFKNPLEEMVSVYKLKSCVGIEDQNEFWSVQKHFIQKEAHSEFERVESNTWNS